MSFIVGIPKVAEKCDLWRRYCNYYEWGCCVPCESALECISRLYI